MFRLNRKLIEFVFLLVSSILLSGCDQLIDFVMGTKLQPISGAIEIGTTWQEITPPKPLTSTASIHYVSLRMPEAIWRDAIYDQTDKSEHTLIYADGSKGKIEAVLFDEKGEAYELRISALGDGFDLGRAFPPRHFSDPPRATPDFPKNHVYTRLKIRSDIVLKLDRIEWTGSNQY